MNPPACYPIEGRAGGARCGRGGERREITRRDFIARAARYGGAAAFGAMLALDLVARDRGGFRLEGGAPAGRNRRVVVLGAGMAGLATGYELMRAGYEVILLEARARPGGRCWTVRGGDEETDTLGETQRCAFAPGQYFNAGPMRISHLHRTVLDYCREFGVPLVAFTNFNTAGYILRAGQPRRRIREITADLRGYTSELLAKAAKRGPLDRPLTDDDRARLVDYLRGEARLDLNLEYTAGDSSAFKFYPEHPRGYMGDNDGPGELGAPTLPLDLETLLRAGYASPDYMDHLLYQQATMLAPPGGMDRIAAAFAERLGDRIRHLAEAVEIRRRPDGGVRIVYADGARGGETADIGADYCVCAMPPHTLAGIANDFAGATRQALQLSYPDTAGKIGMQFKRRFWEEDDGIFGGRSLTDDPIQQIHYPMDGFGTPGPAVLTGYYHFVDVDPVFAVPHRERERIALAQGARVHPQYDAEFDSSFSVEWGRVRHSGVAFSWWKSDDDFDRMHEVLLPGDGPFLFAGDWMTHLSGWQAGAFMSAHRVVREIHERAHA